MCQSVGLCMSAGAFGDQKRVSDILELELWAVNMGAGN